MYISRFLRARFTDFSLASDIRLQVGKRPRDVPSIGVSRRQFPYAGNSGCPDMRREIRLGNLRPL